MVLFSINFNWLALSETCTYAFTVFSFKKTREEFELQKSTNELRGWEFEFSLSEIELRQSAIEFSFLELKFLFAAGKFTRK